MKRVLSGIVLLALFPCSVLAGGYFMNDTGETVYGLRVEFSEPVTITSFGDVLSVVEPLGESTTFTFSGGAVEPWGAHWITWSPASASVVSQEWLSADWNQAADAVAEDFDYEVILHEINKAITISRHIDRNCLPFSVRYEIISPESLDGYTLVWDTDKYVDTDENGNPQDDHDQEGTSLDLIFLENYNPTITLLIRDRADDPVAQWENMVRNDFTIGIPIVLHGGLLLPADSIAPDSAEWSQLHMQQMSLEYMTEYEGSISQASQLVAEATHSEPGRYVYQLEAHLESGAQTRTTVAAWVPPTTSQRKTCGFTMADLWNEYYDEGSQSRINLAMFFSDQHAVDKLGFLESQGFSEILVHNFFPILEAYPLPRISFTGGHFLGDEDMAFVFRQIEGGGVQWGSYYFGEDATVDGGSYWSYSNERTRDYISCYLEQYAGLAVEKAAHAEEIGLSSFAFAQDPYLWGLDMGLRIEATRMPGGSGSSGWASSTVSERSSLATWGWSHSTPSVVFARPWTEPWTTSSTSSGPRRQPGTSHLPGPSMIFVQAMPAISRQRLSHLLARTNCRSGT